MKLKLRCPIMECVFNVYSFFFLMFSFVSMFLDEKRNCYDARPLVVYDESYVYAKRWQSIRSSVATNELIIRIRVRKTEKSLQQRDL